MSVGPVDVERHRQLAAQGVHLHVFVNGVDVTSRCRFACDVPPYAELFKLNAAGKKYFDVERSEVAIEYVHAGVDIREGEPFAAYEEEGG